jgi:hypothetical protein
VLANSRYCPICCWYYTSDYIPISKVWAPSPLAKFTMKRVKMQFALMARGESADVLQQAYYTQKYHYYLLFILENMSPRSNLNPELLWYYFWSHSLFIV